MLQAIRYFVVLLCLFLTLVFSTAMLSAAAPADSPTAVNGLFWGLRPLHPLV